MQKLISKTKEDTKLISKTKEDTYVVHNQGEEIMDSILVKSVKIYKGSERIIGILTSCHEKDITVIFKSETRNPAVYYTDEETSKLYGNLESILINPKYSNWNHHPTWYYEGTLSDKERLISNTVEELILNTCDNCMKAEITECHGIGCLLFKIYSSYSPNSEARLNNQFKAKLKELDNLNKKGDINAMRIRSLSKAKERYAIKLKEIDKNNLKELNETIDDDVNGEGITASKHIGNKWYRTTLLRWHITGNISGESCRSCIHDLKCDKQHPYKITLSTDCRDYVRDASYSGPRLQQLYILKDSSGEKTKEEWRDVPESANKTKEQDDSMARGAQLCKYEEGDKHKIWTLGDFQKISDDSDLRYILSFDPDKKLDISIYIENTLESSYAFNSITSKLANVVKFTFEDNDWNIFGDKSDTSYFFEPNEPVIKLSDE